MKEYNSDFIKEQDVQKTLISFMADSGLPFYGDILILDGRVHRYSCRLERKKEKDEWYIGSILSNGHFTLTIDSYRLLNARKNYHSFGEKEFPNFQKELESIKEKILMEEQAEEKKRVPQALGLWKSLKICLEHPYLEKKKIPGINVRSNEEVLYIPMQTIEGEFKSLQKILPDSSKRFFPGIKTKGLVHIVGKPSDNGRIFVCEGYADAVSIHLATNCPAICAFSCHNLLEVGKKLQEKYPHARIILAADNDEAGNISITQWKKFLNSDVFQAAENDFSDDYVVHGKTFVQDKLLPNKSKLKARSIKEILSLETVELTFLNEYVPLGSYTVVYGYSGTGKSSFSWEMMLCASIGENFAFFQQQRKVRTLVIDGEMSMGDIKSRMKDFQLRYSESEINEEDFKIISSLDFLEETGELINLFNPNHREMIGEVFDDYDVIILDNYTSLTLPPQKSDPDKNRYDFRMIYDWMRKYKDNGKTFIFVMHTTKNRETLSGAQDIHNLAESLLFLYSDPAKQAPESSPYSNLVSFELHPVKVRGLPEYKRLPYFMKLLKEVPDNHGWKYRVMERKY